MIDHKWLKELARIRVKNKTETIDDLEVFLGIWWSRKYNMPSNHPLFLDRTIEEHLLDYYTHQLLDSPESENTTQTVQELEELDEWYKKEMGEDFHEEYDYLVPPIEVEENNIKTKNNNLEEEKQEEDFEEDFEL
jgi:hypothetical protein